MPNSGATVALATLLVCGVAVFGAGPVEASSPRAKSMYVYELSDGSRVVTDYPLNSRHYRLVRTGVDTRGLGQLAASRSEQFFRTDPNAYDEIIRRIAAEHEVDFALVKAIMHVESSFNPYARSPKGALGLMQVLPETARRYGVHDIYDPEQNIEAGVRHLKYLLKLFGHKQFLVLAAYNAGENAVHNHRGIPPYRETQMYVRRVLRWTREYSRS